MAQKFIDQTTIQPDGKPGDDAFTAFATCNDNFHDAEQRLATLEAVGEDVEGLKTGLQQEAQLRADADTAEANARQNADAAIGARIAGKNLLINGDFRIWERGTNFQAATGQRYTADRWQANATGSTIWVQRVDVPPGGGTVPMLKDSKYMLQAIVSSVANAANFALIQQRIEGLRANSGKTLTVSFKAKASVADFKIGVEFQQSFGVGGSAGVDSIGASVTLGVDWQQYSVAIPVPSVVGKTFSDGDYLQLSLWLDAGATYGGRSFGAGQKSGTVSIAEVQVEAGALATGFEYRPDALELLLCQRYCYAYEVTTGNAFVICHGLGNSQVLAFLEAPNDMRTIPTARSVGAPPTLTGVGMSGGASIVGQSYIPVSKRTVALVATANQATTGSASGYLGSGAQPYRVLFEAEL